MDYEQFKTQIYTLTHIDLNAYKERQMKRRIDALITKNKYDGYSTYVQAIKNDKALFEEFVNYLTINVSEFFRNPDLWVRLEKEIFPEMIKKSGGRLRIWSAACSTGDEPYSLVMTLSRFMPLDKIRIIATDIDNQVLEKAQVGLYNEKSIAAVPKDLKEKYFTKVGEKNYQISDSIKKCVEFKKHNLLKDSYPDNLDMIVCRNVVIYFTDEAKNEIYKKFHSSLKDDGILFVGSTEQIMAAREIGFASLKTFFYKKV